MRFCPGISALQNVNSWKELPEKVERAAREAVGQRVKQSGCLSAKDVEAIAAAEVLARGFIWKPSANWVKDLRAELDIARKRRKYVSRHTLKYMGALICTWFKQIEERVCMRHGQPRSRGRGGAGRIHRPPLPLEAEHLGRQPTDIQARRHMFSSLQGSAY